MVWFETILVVLTLLTGIIWLLDKLFLAKRRAARGFFVNAAIQFARETRHAAKRTGPNEFARFGNVTTCQQVDRAGAGRRFEVAVRWKIMRHRIDHLRRGQSFEGALVIRRKDRQGQFLALCGRTLANGNPQNFGDLG